MNRLKLKDFFIWTFVLVNIADVISTALATSKHGAAYEMNIIYVWTGSILAMLAFKIIMVSLMVYFYLRLYDRCQGSLTRYFIIYASVILWFALLGASIGNYTIYQMDHGTLGPAYTSEEKIEYVKNEMSTLNNLEPGSVSNSFAGLFWINMIQFLVWRSFEKWKKKSIKAS